MAEPTTPPTAPTPPGPPWWRTGAGIVGIVAAVAVLVIAVVAFAVTGGDDGGGEAGATSTSAGRSGGASGASGPSGASGATGSGSSGKGGKDAKGSKGGNEAKGGSTTTTTPPATIETTPDGEADLARIRVAITPGTCLWNADTLDLTARGTIRNDNGLDAIVSIDVTFLDASGGEVDTASDLAILGPGEQASWDVLGASIDPPTGGLRCEVALS